MSKQQKKRKELAIDSFFPGSSQDMTQEIDQELPTNFKDTLEGLKIQLTHELKNQLTQELKIQLIQKFKKQSREPEDKLKKEIHELKENKVLKAKIDQLENEGKTKRRKMTKKPRMKLSLFKSESNKKKQMTSQGSKNI